MHLDFLTILLFTYGIPLLAVVALVALGIYMRDIRWRR
jgi:hypothetical protein